MVGFLAETSVTQQLTKMNVKQSHLLLICKGWSFIKQNNLWLLLKWPSFFTKSKKKISVPRYQIGNTQGIVEKTRPFCSLCCLHNTDIESLIYSIYEISVPEHQLRMICKEAAYLRIVSQWKASNPGSCGHFVFQMWQQAVIRTVDTHHRERYHCTADLLFGSFRFDHKAHSDLHKLHAFMQ